MTLYAAALLEGILVGALIFAFALLDLVHLHVPFAYAVRIQNIFAGIAAAVRKMYQLLEASLKFCNKTNSLS